MSNPQDHERDLENASPDESDNEGLTQSGLKNKIVKGGLYLALRQLVTVGLSVISILVIAKKLGPANYGVLVNALGIFYFITWTGKLGLHVYLIQKKHLPDDAPAQVLAFFNALSLVFTVGLLVLAPLIGWWTKAPEVTALIRCLPVPIAAELAASVSVAMLERNLAFDEVGLIEIYAQVANYLVALPLVLGGAGYWGPIAGLGFRGVVMLGLAQRKHRVPWRSPLALSPKKFLQPGWDWAFLKPALRYGFTFSLSHWVISMRALTIPVVVTPLAGTEAAGLVSIAIRLAEQLSTLRMVIRRMSISVMAKLTDNAEAVRSTISRGMAYQALLIGSICSAFACLDSWVVPLLFGDDWLKSTLIFPFIALSAMVRAMFDLHAGALYAVERNSAVTRAYVVYIVLLWLGCAMLMPVIGLWGYGVAELLTVLSNVWLHRPLVKVYGSPNYGAALWLTLAAMVPILGSLVSPGAGIVAFLLGYGLVLLVPAVRVIPLELMAAVKSRRQPAVES